MEHNTSILYPSRLLGKQCVEINIYITMPRGAEFDHGVPQSDNPIEAREDLIHGGSKVKPPQNPLRITRLIRDFSAVQPTSESSVAGAHKAAPLPEGLNEVPDGVHSGGGSRGVPGYTGSGKGGHEPKSLGENKGQGAHMEVDTAREVKEQ